MNSNQAKLFAFEYQGGRTVTDRLLKVMNVKDYQTLASKLNIPKATISTWHSREQTPFEIISRIHLKTGVSMRWLLLGEGEMYEQATTTTVTKSKIMLNELKNGQLKEVREMGIDDQTLADFGLEKEDVLAVRETGNIYFIDCSQISVSSGEYLIGIDEIFSISYLQKLPKKNISIEFGNSSNSTVKQDDIKIIGKIIKKVI